jgi:hypothetical protein
MLANPSASAPKPRRILRLGRHSLQSRAVARFRAGISSRFSRMCCAKRIVARFVEFGHSRIVFRRLSRSQSRRMTRRNDFSPLGDRQSSFEK